MFTPKPTIRLNKNNEVYNNKKVRTYRRNHLKTPIFTNQHFRFTITHSKLFKTLPETSKEKLKVHCKRGTLPARYSSSVVKTSSNNE